MEDSRIHYQKLSTLKCLATTVYITSVPVLVTAVAMGTGLRFPVLFSAAAWSRTYHSTKKKLILKHKSKSLNLSVRVFSTVALIVDTVNKQTTITNTTETC